ncbi:MAG: phosphate uptake regulator PhoU [Candidatus Micrarchaeota archaeon]
MEIPRRIQLTGRNTYIVSLPHEWVQKSGVSKGDGVFLNQNEDGTLTLSLKKAERELKTVALEVSAESPATGMRNIVSAYVGGAGRIVLSGKGTHTIAEEARRVLSGVEITDEEGEKVTLRILAFEDVQTDNIIKREFNVTQSMFALVMGALRDGADTHTEISRKESEVDRLYLLVLRNLCIGSYKSSESVFKAITAKSMEKVSDHLVELSVLAREGPDARIAVLLEKAQKAYSSAYKAFAGCELDRGEFGEARKDFQEEFSRLEAGLRKEKTAARMLGLRSLMEKCNKIVRYAEDILENSGDMVFARMGGQEI